ncbi:MAG: stalk domain-containing protein [Oscillospiraceae bacterium]|nr:stalk domain-containing protein [Oscillospiraceae bacterium]
MKRKAIIKKLFNFIIIAVLCAIFTNTAYAETHNPIVAVDAGGAATFAVQQDGTLWAWGGSMNAAHIGDGALEIRSRPVAVMQDVTDVAAGWSHALALTSDGTVWAWGGNNQGQLGNGRAANLNVAGTFNSDVDSAVPIRVALPVRAVSITVSFNTSLAITEDGALWIWGAHHNPSPTRVLEDVIKADFDWGARNIYAIRSDNSLWRLNSHQRLTHLLDNIAYVSSNSHVLALGKDGSVWTWNDDQIDGPDGSHGQNPFHISTTESFWERTPRQIMTGAVGIYAGNRTSMIIMENGDLLEWGSYPSWTRFVQRLDPGTTELTPETASGVELTDFFSDLDYPINPIRDVIAAAGQATSVKSRIAIRSDGSVWVWGHGTRLGLGDGFSLTSHATPLEENHFLTPFMIFDSSGAYVGESNAPTEQPMTEQPPLLANNNDISVLIDNQRLSFEVSPQIINGRTMLPMRAIFEAMGAEVEWRGETQTATARKGDTTVVLTVGSTSPTVNGVVVPIDQVGVIVAGRTLAPLRFVAEAFGGTVRWDNATRTAAITSG